MGGFDLASYGPPRAGLAHVPSSSAPRKDSDAEKWQNLTALSIASGNPRPGPSAGANTAPARHGRGEVNTGEAKMAAIQPSETLPRVEMRGAVPAGARRDERQLVADIVARARAAQAQFAAADQAQVDLAVTGPGLVPL